MSYGRYGSVCPLCRWVSYGGTSDGAKAQAEQHLATRHKSSGVPSQGCGTPEQDQTPSPREEQQ